MLGLLTCDQSRCRTRARWRAAAPPANTQSAHTNSWRRPGPSLRARPDCVETGRTRLPSGVDGLAAIRPQTRSPAAGVATLASRRVRKRTARHEQPDRDNRNVAIAIVRCTPAREEKESSRWPTPRDRVPSRAITPIGRARCPRWRRRQPHRRDRFASDRYPHGRRPAQTSSVERDRPAAAATAAPPGRTPGPP